MGDKSPLLPIFAAIDDLGGYNFKTLDLVSDRNNLRKLIRWATGTANEKDFRIDIDLAGNTCLFTRRDEMDKETIVGFRGFGHNYERAATRPAPGCGRATGHHRIISVVCNCTHPLVCNLLTCRLQNFGGLKVLLRFEVDACTGVDADDLSSAFSGLGITSNNSPASTTARSSSAISGISIVRTTPRTLVPQSSLIELKTRASHKPLDWDEVYPQLYLSQTPYLYLAKHTRGAFIGVESVQLAGSSMRTHAKRAEAGMVKLKAVLDDILNVVRGEARGVKFSLVCERGRLALYKRKEGTGKIIGSDILSKFE
jgi:hypothetical protein